MANYIVRNSKSELDELKEYASDMCDQVAKDRKPKEKAQYNRKMVNDNHMVKIDKKTGKAKHAYFTNAQLRKAEKDLKEINNEQL